MLSVKPGSKRSNFYQRSTKVIQELWALSTAHKVTKTKELCTEFMVFMLLVFYAIFI